MKKFFVITMVVWLAGIFCATSYADDSVFFGVDPDNKVGNLIKPPNDVSELVGKVITFTDKADPQKNTWHCLVVGSSEHVMSMYKGVVLYVGNINYLGYQVKQLSYNANGSGEWWQIEYYTPAGYLEPESRHDGHIREKSERIQVISIK